MNNHTGKNSPVNAEGEKTMSNYFAGASTMTILGVMAFVINAYIPNSLGYYVGLLLP